MSRVNVCISDNFLESTEKTNAKEKQKNTHTERTQNKKTAKHWKVFVHYEMKKKKKNDENEQPRRKYDNEISFQPKQNPW